ncbi:MAG: molybdopterin/thiamine biosynthesis adenylyltransferase [Desulforhopalus sp.]|jgi:molybdopterin/thiamine biosynthesis adenylyltransferase
MREKIILLLKEYSEQKRRPDNSPFIALDLKQALEIAEITKTTLHEVEEVALSTGITPTRYSRNQRALSINDQKKLHQAHIAVIGLGGLGGGVTELLSRIGIGNLTLIDGDSFDESNLNRQLLSTVSNIGIPKATVAGKRVKEINPAIRVQTHLNFLGSENGYELLKEVDIAIDCLDTISDRFVLEQVCKKRKIPMISAAIAGKSGQITVVFPEEKGLVNLYGSAENAPIRGVESSLGTLPFTASFMASIECAEAVNLILNKDSILRNGFLFSDLGDYSIEHIKTC